MKITRLKCVLAIFVAIITNLILAVNPVHANQTFSNLTYFNSSSSMRSSADEKRIFRLINEERAKYRAGSLTWNSSLAMVARNYSSSMATENFFGHKDRKGKSLVDRLKAFDVTNWSGIGENLYFCQGMDDPTEAAVAGWLKSSGHKSNLLNGSWKSTGIGISTSSDGKIYVTQIFMK